MNKFIKANVASLVASGCDYGVTILLKQLLGLDAVLASILGTVFGGIVNFFIGRFWVFKSADASFLKQGKRYLLTWTGNLVLNALGVYVLIRLAGLHYIVAKLITSLTVAFAYNYPMQKMYVFKNIKSENKA